jgi:hypothetical protein
MNGTRVIDFFQELDDNRRSLGDKQHELLDVIAISICAVIFGAESFEENRGVWKSKEEMAFHFLGIAKRDSFTRYT